MQSVHRFLVSLPIAAVAVLAQTNSAPGVTILAVPAPSTLPLPGFPVGSPPSLVIPPLPPRGNAEPAVLAGETTVTLDVGFGIRAVLPSRITVPVGESLRILAPTIGVNTNYIWTKNGRAIADASGNALVFNRVASSDAGTYACLFSLSPTSTQSSQSLVLGVGPIDRLLNLSTRTTVGGAADQGLISGFVVSGSAQGKKLILRAVGPSLAQFGVSNPHRAPILRIFDGSGKPYENGYVYPAVVGGPTYESDLADSLARAGAFAISAGTRDAVLMMPFTPGSYTAQVTSGDGTSGVVLLEIYEVP